MTNNQRIREYIKGQGLTYIQASIELSVSISTIKAWMLPPDNKAYRNCPDVVIKLIDCLESK